MKVVIAYSDVAGGHRSAAEAIELAFKTKYSKVETSSIDLLKIISRFPFLGMEASWEMATKYKWAEFFIGNMFRLAQLDTVHKWYGKLVNLVLAEPGKKVLDDLQPDIVISTHLIVSNVLENIKRRNGKYMTVSIATDLVDFPRPLADQNSDLVFAPTDAAAMRFQRFGIAADKVAFPYYPVPPKMKKFRPQDEVLDELGLSQKKTTILVTGGGYGSWRMITIIDELLTRDDLQFIFAAGRDEGFKVKLRSRYREKENIKILDFVSNFQDYLNACDLIVAKPGPATIVEVELFQKKAVFTKHIGIQEVGNLFYLERNPNFRNVGGNTHLLLPAIEELLATDYIPYEPRFKFDAAEEIADRIMQEYQLRNSK